MDKHLIFYLTFIPTAIFFIGGMTLHLQLCLELKKKVKLQDILELVNTLSEPT
jgi:TM2 domain-containing membrane protein YozV